MKNFVIGGVPEHFNLAWYLTLKDKRYQKEDINLRWRDYHGGTGDMCKALRNKDIDLAVILTEGIIRDIIHGNNAKIVQVFVKSPLLWGIHVDANSSYSTVKDLKGSKAAISRFGSGSHLMAYINAENYQWDLKNDLHFEVIDNLEGALNHLPKGKGDYFLWEKFTTKPYVDQGIFKSLGNCPTPWPCFVIAVRNDVLENDPESIKAILNIINKETAQFKNLPEIDKYIANRYNQQLTDVQEWLSLTQWSQEQLSHEQLSLIQEKLLKLHLIPNILNNNDLLHTIA